MTKQEILEQVELRKRELDSLKDEKDEEIIQLESVDGLIVDGKMNTNIHSDVSLYKLFALYIRANSSEPLTVPLDLENDECFSEKNLCSSRNVFVVLNNGVSLYKKYTETDVLVKSRIVKVMMKKLYSMSGLTLNDVAAIYDLRQKYPSAFNEASIFVTTLAKVRTEEGGIHRPKISRQDVIVLSGGPFDNKIKRSTYFSSHFGVIANYYANLLNRKKKSAVAVNKRVAKYEAFRRMFEGVKDDQVISDLSSIVSNIEDDDLKRKALIYVYEHNNAIYDEIEKKRVGLFEEVNWSFVQEIFNKYGITSDMYDVEEFKNIPLENIETILSKMAKLKISNVKLVLDVVRLNDIDALDKIQSLAEQSILSLSFLNQYKSVFDSSSKDFGNLMSNIDALNTLGLPLPVYQFADETLLFSNEVVSSNLSFLNKYGLIETVKNKTDISFLGNEKLNVLVDKVLELGYKNILQADLNILNYSENDWKKVQILRNMGEDISDYQSLLECLEISYFIVPDDKLDDYIFTYVPKEINDFVNQLPDSGEALEPECLFRYFDSSLTYSFDGVIISKSKVLRNLAKLQNVEMDDSVRLFYSIVNNSDLSFESYSSIKHICGVKDTVLKKVNQ